MDQFHYIVLGIATVALILVLTYMGIFLTSSSYNKSVYPPTQNTCPDYWLLDESGRCIIPSSDSANYPINRVTNSTYGYNSSSNSIDFNNSAWSTTPGLTQRCALRNWSIDNGITWDGITNFNQC